MIKTSIHGLGARTVCQAVTAINKQIHSLARVIDSPTHSNVVSVQSSSPNVPVHAIAKKHGGAIYVFAVSLYHQETEATFRVAGLEDDTVVEVLDEDRSISVKNGQFTDRFQGYDVQFYRIR